MTTSLQRTVIECEVLATQLMQLNGLRVNNPENTNTISTWDTENNVVLRSDEDDHGPLALQQPKPVDEVESGDRGYGAFMHFITTKGQRMGTLGYDKTADDHDHLGFYTNDGLPGDGSDSQPTKRMNIQGGSEVTEIDFYGVNDLRFGQRGSGDGAEGNLDFVMEGEENQTQYINMREDGQSAFSVIYRPDWGENGVTRLYKYGGDDEPDTDVRLRDGMLAMHSGGPDGEGAIQLGDGGPIIYSDGGHVYAENIDGEEELIV